MTGEDEDHELEACEACGIDETDTATIRRGLCAWCRADRDGRPWGTCPACKGARAADGSCACSVRA